MCRFSVNVVRSSFLSRVTKQSRKGILPFSSISLVNCMSAFCPLRCSTNVKDKDEPSDRRGAVYKIKCCDCQATYIGETGRNLNVRLTEHKRATRNGDINNHIAEHHLKTNHRIDWDSAECVTYSTDYYQRISLESWFTNLEQTPLNRCQQLPAPYKRLIADNNKTDKQ